MPLTDKSRSAPEAGRSHSRVRSLAAGDQAAGRQQLPDAKSQPGRPRLLDQIGDDEALSLRAVARAVSISPTSVYLYFPDRDALVLAAMQRCHEQLVEAGDEAEATFEDPAARLGALLLAQCAWAQSHPGLYKVLHESKVHRRLGMPFKEALMARTAAAVQRCMDAGIAAPGDAATVALDLRTAVNGMLSQRINEPDLPWPPVDEQLGRFLTKLAGLGP